MPKPFTEGLLDLFQKWIGFSVLIALLDQLSKCWAVASLAPDTPWVIFSWLNFYLTYNPGAAFGLLAHAGGWQRWALSGFSFTTSLVIIYQIYNTPAIQRIKRIALSFALGGAWGNLYDRIQYGTVVDFIDIHLGDWHFSIFNLADCALCVGAMLWLLAYFKTEVSKVV